MGYIKMADILIPVTVNLHFKNEELADAKVILRLWENHQRYLMRWNGRLLLNDKKSGIGAFAISPELFPSLGEMEIVDLVEAIK